MAPETRLALTLRALAERKFVAAGYVSHGGRRFRGHLPSPKGPLRVSVTIRDWDFLVYPTIQVESGLERFPELRPHLDRFGDLCYFERRRVVLDRYDPATAIVQCLTQAESVLAHVLSDANYRVADIQNEFLIHWERQEPEAFTVRMGSVKKGALTAPLHFGADLHPAILADDRHTAEALAKALGQGPLNAEANRCWLFRTEKLPPVPLQFPRNLLELFDWLRQWDRHLYNGIQRVLTIPEAYQYVCLPFAVHTPVGWIGFMFRPNAGAKGTPSQKKQYLHAQAAQITMDRISLFDVSPEFVHSRNLAFRDLTDKRITVVGCGAIGSHLAAALVRLGAGQGNGLLRLIDSDTLQPENLGRHLLGYNMLGRWKASALREELLRQFPLSRIEAVDKGVEADRSLFSADLIIDATGDQLVSEYLNGTWLDAARPCPILYVWIQGNGECVQSLWCDTADHACFRCLRLNNPERHREERFPVLKHPVDHRVIGCTGFTPYAVSSAFLAASLAGDVVCDWMQGRCAPRYRTRFRENVDVHPVVNADHPPLTDCPACAGR